MRILFFVHGLPPESRGGVEIQALRLAEGLKARGETVSFISGRATIRRGHAETVLTSCLGIPVLNIFRRVDRPLLPDEIYDQEIIGEVSRAIDDFRPDIVHIAHLRNLGLGLIDLLLEKGIPYIASVHDHWWWCPAATRLRRDLSICPFEEYPPCEICFGCGEDERLHAILRCEAGLRALERAERVAVPGRVVRQWVMRRTNRKDPVILPYSVPRFGMVRRKGIGHSSGGRIGYIGTVAPHKGLDHLIEAAGLMASRHHIIIHGGGPPDYIASLERKAREKGIDARFTGAYRPDEVPALLASIDLLVVPSIWEEALTIVVLEARRCGVPLVVSAIGGLVEAAAGSGEAVPPRDPEALARAMEEGLLKPREVTDHGIRDEVEAAAELGSIMSEIVS